MEDEEENAEDLATRLLVKMSLQQLNRRLKKLLQISKSKKKRANNANGREPRKGLGMLWEDYTASLHLQNDYGTFQYEMDRFNDLMIQLLNQNVF